MTATSSTVVVRPTGSESIRVRLGRLQRRVPIVQLVLLVVAFVYGSVALPGFGTFQSVRSILVIASLVGIAAMGQTLVVLIGGFDLSVSGFIVAGALTVTQLAIHYKISFGVAFVLMLVGAAVLGGLTGWICSRFSIQPLVVTLATGAIATGLVQVQTGGGVAGAAPEWLSALASPITPTFGIPLPPIIVIWLVGAVLLGLFLRYTVAGRRIYYTGANAKAADLSLVRTRWVWIGVFAFSAVIASFAGVMLAGFAGNVDGTLGGPYLFQSLAAVIVGGTVFGGPGDYWRTVVGTVLLTELSTLLIGQGFSQADQQVLYGVVILVAMALYGRESRVNDRI